MTVEDYKLLLKDNTDIKLEYNETKDKFTAVVYLHLLPATAGTILKGFKVIARVGGIDYVGIISESCKIERKKYYTKDVEMTLAPES